MIEDNTILNFVKTRATLSKSPVRDLYMMLGHSGAAIDYEKAFSRVTKNVDRVRYFQDLHELVEKEILKREPNALEDLKKARTAS